MIKIRFAVCDDDGMICDAVSERVCSIFENHGLTVFCERFTSPEDLLSRINRGEAQFDLLFLDIDMPVMNGLNLAQIVRQKMEKRSISFSFPTEKIKCLIHLACILSDLYERATFPGT